MIGRPARIDINGRSARLVLQGEIDLLVVQEVRAALAAAQERHVSALDVDLGLVDFLDSSGLGVLAQAAAEFDRLRVVAAPISIMRTLEITGLGALLALDDAAEG